ncbi:MAG: DUF4124 domain-containing protein [Xanthomonadales bacterium]|nr:DUF4124 domain-containing protein [Xanthomonadales bacterium]
MPRRIYLLSLLAGAYAFEVAAQQIYHWVDENGVPVYSQNPPPGETVAKILHLEPRTPDPDAGEDLYDVEAQQQRMQELREAMARKREQRSERAGIAQPPRAAPPQAVTHPLWHLPQRSRPRPPGRKPGRPEPKPEPPDSAPAPTATLKPPGRDSN